MKVCPEIAFIGYTDITFFLMANLSWSHPQRIIVTHIMYPKHGEVAQNVQGHH